MILSIERKVGIQIRWMLRFRTVKNFRNIALKVALPLEVNQTMVVDPTIANGGKQCRNVIPIKKSIITNSDLLAQCRKRKNPISNDAALGHCSKRSKLIAPTTVHSYVNNKKDTGKSGRRGNIKLKIQKAKSLSRKYCRIRGSNDSIKMASTKGEYVKKLTKKLRPHSVGECFFEAERIIKWCLTLRGKKIFALRQALQSLKQKADVCLTLRAAVSDFDKNSRIVALCGSVRKHTAHSEPYYKETAYVRSPNIVESIVMDVEGKATNVLPLVAAKKTRRKSRTWDCSELCGIPDDTVLSKFEKFNIIIRNISLCRLKTVSPRIRKCTEKNIEGRWGHSQACYIEPFRCESLLLSLEFLPPHFPQVRLLNRLFNKISALLRSVGKIDEALNPTNVENLHQFANKAKENATHFQSTGEILLDEDAILRKYEHAFLAFQKKASKLPRFPCMSCQKLCCLTDVRTLDNIRVLPTGQIWDDLKLFIEKNEECDSDYICQYCLTKFRSGSLPPTCILNNLHVCAVPTPLAELNEYEQILIQRVRAFQTVVKMGSVQKKKYAFSQNV
nr:hypothetical protein 3 [Hyposoter didymator ichnovirus]